jgi:hypothetical protein
MKRHPLVRISLVTLMLVGAFIAGQQSSRPVAAQSRQKWRRSAFSKSGSINSNPRRSDAYVHVPDAALNERGRSRRTAACGCPWYAAAGGVRLQVNQFVR